MKRITLFAFAMGLSMMALHASPGAAAPTCPAQCNQNYKQCQKVCSQNDCIISCDTKLQSCMSSCSS